MGPLPLPGDVLAIIIIVLFLVFSGPRQQKHVRTKFYEESWHKHMLENDIVYKEINDALEEREENEAESFGNCVDCNVPIHGWQDAARHARYHSSRSE